MAEAIADRVRDAAANAAPTPGNANLTQPQQHYQETKARGKGEPLRSGYGDTTLTPPAELAREKFERLVEESEPTAIAKEMEEARLMLDPDGWSSEAQPFPTEWPKW